MNKEYTSINDKVIVSDYDGNQKIVEYQDNIEEILIQENVIEEEEQILLDSKQKLEKNKLSIKGDKLLLEMTIPLTVIFSLVVFHNLDILNLTGIIVASFFGLISVGAFIAYKNDKNNLKNNKIKLRIIEEQIKKEKTKLKELKKKKQKKLTKEKNGTINNVSNLEKLELFKENLVTLFELECKNQKEEKGVVLVKKKNN